MALSVDCGQFATTTSSTTQSVTVGAGWQPKGIMFFGTTLTANSSRISVGTNGFFLGYSDGTNHVCSAVASNNAANPTVCGRAFSTTKCIIVLSNGTPTVANQATVAFTSTGFTLTWDSQPGTAYLICYYALGGSDITNVAVGSDTMRTATGTQATTVGFQSSAVFFISSQLTSATTSSGLKFMMGMSDGTHHWASDFSGINNVASAPGSLTGCSNARPVVGMTDAGVNDFAATLSAWNSTSFTLNYTTAAPSAYLFGYMAIAGGVWQVGAFQKITTSGNQAVAITNISKGLFMIGSGSSSSTASTIPMTIALGTAVSSSERCAAGLIKSNTVPGNTWGIVQSATCYDNGVLVSGLTADFVSWDATPTFTINWLQSDSFALYHGFIVVAQAPSTPAITIDIGGQSINNAGPMTLGL